MIWSSSSTSFRVVVTTCSYEAASSETGQSEPNMQRSAPNQSITRRTYGSSCSADHDFHSASVKRPETLHVTLARSLKGASAASQAECLGPAALRGLAA